jgi:hypothetical protein
MTVEQALAGLVHPERAVRRDAERALAAFGPEAVPGLSAALQANAEEIAAVAPAADEAAGFWLMLLVPMPHITLCVLGILLDSWFAGRVVLAGVLTLPVLYGAAGLYRSRARRAEMRRVRLRHARLIAGARALTETEDLRLVGAFAESLHRVGGDLDPRLARILTGLLPRLRASDAPLLSRAQRECLRRVVSPSYAHVNAELCVAAMRALTAVGDVDSLEAVAGVASSAAASDRERAVRAVARECLPTLRDLAAHEDYASRLLRPANGSSDALLRPAGAGATPEELLLRSASAIREVQP